MVVGGEAEGPRGFATNYPLPGGMGKREEATMDLARDGSAFCNINAEAWWKGLKPNRAAFVVRFSAASVPPGHTE